MKELVDILRAWEIHRDEAHALATLVRARGSSYRRPGARMLITSGGLTIGSLSGGCLEEEVALAGRHVIRSGEATLMNFDMRRRFGCHGDIGVFVERVSDDFLNDLTRHFFGRATCVAVTRYDASEELGSRILQPDESIPARAFAETIEPPIQLLLIGEGPDSAPLRSLAEVLGWSVIAVKEISELSGPLDDRTAAVVKTHNYGRDFAALRAVLPLGLRYVGLVGPRKRREQLLADLLDVRGRVASDLFAPAGVDLGAKTPEEIALSIISEIQKVFADAPGESLRDRRAPVHASRERSAETLSAAMTAL